MLSELLAWGLKPAMVTGDSWYSCAKNLKVIKNNGLGFMFAIEKGSWQQVQALDIPADGLEVWLKDFGKVKFFRTRLKDQLRHYVVYLPNEEKLSQFDHWAFDLVHDTHWQIEQYHRVIKQVCNIENFQVRGNQATKNHLFAAIFGYVKLQRLTTIQAIRNCYQKRQDLLTHLVTSFISECHIGENSLGPLFSAVVNA